MIIKETKLKGSYIIKLSTKCDNRGYFNRLYCDKEFLKKKLNTKWVQVNLSSSKKIGTLRGLHIQMHASSETKLIRCTRGMIWDVIVDLRKKSKTYGKWFGSFLSETNFQNIYVPKGFAHGYLSLKNNSQIVYLVSNYYNPKSEKVLAWNDKDINIKWPIKPKIISSKDKKGISFKNF